MRLREADAARVAVDLGYGSRKQSMEAAPLGARRGAVECVADGSVTAAAVARARQCRGEVELVGEDTGAEPVFFTNARHASHSRSQLLGSAKANSRNAFLTGLSCSMDWWWGKKLGGFFL